MQRKSADISYCGVDAERIKAAKPKLNMNSVKYLMQFVHDRYEVHLNKDVYGENKPWTDNVVLQQFRFTNVRREHDRQTRYLIENISKNSSLTLEDKIVNTFLFRGWNNWSTMEFFGGPWRARDIYSSCFKECHRKAFAEESKNNPKRLWYSNAYNQGGTKHAWKFPAGDSYQRAYKESEAKKYKDWEPDIPLRVFHLGPWLKQQDIINKLLNSKTQQEAFEVIKSVRGFSDFLAYQIFVDLTYIDEFPFSENEFVIAGPGCKKGLDYIFLDKSCLTYEESLFWLRDNWDSLIHKTASNLNIKELFTDLPKYDRVMNVMSLENCMCELSKYIRAIEGTGRPRNKYKGV